MQRLFRTLRADERGGVLVEATVMLTIMMVFVLGSVDFLMAMYQWNAATKAVQIGARIAAVSSPVSVDMVTMTGLGSGVNPGDPMPYYSRRCLSGGCDVGGYDATAMNTIVYGRRAGNTSCTAAGSTYGVGMCHVFSRVTPANVVITYEHTGLGYAGRPGGPVPTITVSLQNLPFQFFFLGRVLGLGNLTIPVVATSTGEDLSSSAPTT